MTTDSSRRRFLRSAAVTIALPFLPSMFPRAARANCPAEAPKRFLAYYVPNGFHMPDWTPRTVGREWTPPFLLEPLADLKQKTVVITGLENQGVARLQVPPGNHAGGTGCFLTQIPVAENYDDRRRTSLDQLIARRSAACTPLPSLQLGIENASSTGTCDGAPCSFSRSIAWSENTPLPNIVNPQLAFDRLFAGRDSNASAAEARRRAALRASVLDHVTGELVRVERSLAAEDRLKLDEFSTGLRALESRIQSSLNANACEVPARPAESLPVAQHVEIMTELMALALRCDITRVITFMIANSGSGRNHSFIGADGGFHGISHHGGSQANFDKLRTIGRWEVQQLAHLAARLDEMPDLDGRTVLDNTLIYFSSEIADGDRHNHWDLPVLLLGSAGGSLAVDGRHISYTNMTFPRPVIGANSDKSLGDLYVSIQQAFGIDSNTFGANGRAPLRELTP